MFDRLTHRLNTNTWPERAIVSVYAGKGVAERVGFEPTLPFRVNTLSKRAPSATRPSLRRVKDLQQVPSNQVARLCDSLNGGLCCPVSKHDISSLSGNVSIFTTSAQQPSAGTRTLSNGCRSALAPKTEQSGYRHKHLSFLYSIALVQHRARTASRLYGIALGRGPRGEYPLGDSSLFSPVSLVSVFKV